VFFWVVIGLDPLPRPVSWNARIGMLTAAAATHLFVGVGFLFGPMPAEEWFFLIAPLGGLELLDSQRLGATLATGGAVTVLTAVAAWLTVRRRAARRRMARIPAPSAAGTG
jgi:putative copper resistance protein D